MGTEIQQTAAQAQTFAGIVSKIDRGNHFRIITIFAVSITRVNMGRHFNGQHSNDRIQITLVLC